MDTPGLLPRSDEKRNEMEKLTLASMMHLKRHAPQTSEPYTPKTEPHTPDPKPKPRNPKPAISKIRN